MNTTVKESSTEKGLLIVISGPSGAGKGTITQKIMNALPNARNSVSVTTRQPRPGEQEGVHYYFRTLDKYRDMIAKGEFLETAEVHSNYYGTPKRPVLDMLAAGHDCILEIDVRGARQIKSAYPESVLIFLMAPSMNELEQRLRGRGTEDDEALKRRINAARRELSEYKLYDYLVINDAADKCAVDVLTVIGGERHKINRNIGLIKRLLEV